MGRKIGIMLPLGSDHVDSEFCADMIVAFAYHAVNFPDDTPTVHFRRGSILAEQRQELLKEAVEAGAEYCIFLDTDMRFPKDVISRLVDHDLPVMAANCSKRRRPVSFTAREEDPDDPTQLRGVWTEEHSTGIQRVAVVGTAVMSIKTEVLTQLEYPWFAQPYMPDQDSFVGEDLYLMGRLKQAGIPVYIDHDLSKEIGHLGKYEFTYVDPLAERERVDAGLWDHIKQDTAAD